MKSRKLLKVLSIVILVFAGMTLINLVAEFAFGNASTIVPPQGVSEGIVWTLKVVIFAASLLLILPQIYVGAKGVAVSKHPGSSKGHIVWATILLIIAIMGVVFSVVGLLGMEDMLGNVSSLLSSLLDIVIYFFYIKLAKAVSRAR